MKSLFTVMIFAGLMAGSAQAIQIPVLTDCGTLIGNTGGAGTFTGSNAPYQGADQYAGWAIDQILAQGLAADASTFRKWDVSWPGVALGMNDEFVMVHWVGDQGGDQEYQLYDVTTCAQGLYTFPEPPLSSISWIAKLQGTGQADQPGGGGSSVPDGGTTLILLGLALGGLAPVKKLLDR